MLAAINGDIGTGYKRCFFRAEINNQPGHFFRFAEAPNGYLRDNFGIEYILWNCHDHFRSDVARRNGVDGHAFARNFQRQRFGKAMHAGLGGGVIRLAERAF